MAQMQAPTVETVQATEGVTVHKIQGNNAEIRLANLGFLDTADRWAYTAFYNGEAVRTGIAVGQTARDALHVVVVTVNTELSHTAHVGDTFRRMQAFTELGTAKGLAQCQAVIGDSQAIDRGGDQIAPMVCGADLSANGSCPSAILHTADGRLAELPELEDSRVEGYTRLTNNEIGGNDIWLPEEIYMAMGNGQNVIVEHHHNGRTWNRSGCRNGSDITVGEWPADMVEGQPVTVSVARGGLRVRLDY